MPQMAPYNWLFLFLMFNLILLHIITHSHFMTNYTTLTCSKPIKYMYMYSWKW